MSTDGKMAFFFRQELTQTEASLSIPQPSQVMPYSELFASELRVVTGRLQNRMESSGHWHFRHAIRFGSAIPRNSTVVITTQLDAQIGGR